MFRKLLLLACLWPAVTFGLGPKSVPLRQGAASIDRQILALAPVLWLDGKRTSSLTVGSDRAISAWLDKSGNGYDFAQGTAANKPFLTRSDSLENRLKQSEEFDEAGSWSLSYVTVDDQATTDPLGGGGADKVIETANNQIHAINQAFETVKGATYVISVYAKIWNGRNYLTISPTSTGFPAGYITFNLDTGVVSTTSGAATGAIESIGSGWYRCSITITSDESSASSGLFYYITADDGATLTYLGDITKGIYLWGAHLRRSSASSTYLATSTYPVYAGLNGRAVPYFPGAATYMSRAFTAALDIGVGDNTIFAVVKADGAKDTAGGYFIYANETFETRGSMWAFRDTDGVALVRTNQAGGSTSLIGVTELPQTLSLWSARKGTGANGLFVNGVTDGSDTTISNAVSASADAFTLANNASANRGLRGYLPELLVFGRALSNYELGRLTSLIKRREQM